MEYNQKQLSIIEAAEKLFASQGFHGTSVRDIAHEADVNIAMISYYFGSKDKLIEAIFLKRLYTMRMSLGDLFKDTTLTPLQKLDAVVDMYVNRIMKNQCFHVMMMRAQIQIDSTVTDLIHESKKETYELLRGFITDGQEKGVFKNDIDILMMVNTMVGTTNHVMSTKHYYRKMSNLEHLTEEELEAHLIVHLSQHLKRLFKAILINEA